MNHKTYNNHVTLQRATRTTERENHENQTTTAAKMRDLTIVGQSRLPR